jgi:hypothetical protein
MDPFIEMTEWQDFHVTIIVAMKEQLVRQVKPKYIVSAERRVYLEHSDEEDRQTVLDIRLAPVRAEPAPRPAPGAYVGILPETYIAPMPIEQREPYLVIRDRTGHEVVTVIEFLSPTNKRAGSDGYRTYTKKREELLHSPVNLVEIDLLRSGRRPATTKPLRDGTDYCVIVHRQTKRPEIDVNQWQLRDSLPSIPIPLDQGDPDVFLDLQQALTFAYDLSDYEHQLPYHESLQPPARESDSEWLTAILRSLHPESPAN